MNANCLENEKMCAVEDKQFSSLLCDLLETALTACREKESMVLRLVGPLHAGAFKTGSWRDFNDEKKVRPYSFLVYFY